MSSHVTEKMNSDDHRKQTRKVKCISDVLFSYKGNSVTINCKFLFRKFYKIKIKEDYKITNLSKVIRSSHLIK